MHTKDCRNLSSFQGKAAPTDLLTTRMVSYSDTLDQRQSIALANLGWTSSKVHLCSTNVDVIK
jgi:hypothetical protein